MQAHLSSSCGNVLWVQVELVGDGLDPVGQVQEALEPVALLCLAIPDHAGHGKGIIWRQVPLASLHAHRGFSC